MQVTIRQATGKDLPHLRKVSQAAFERLRNVYRPSEEKVEKKARSSDDCMRLVALHGERIVGTVEYRLGPRSLHFMALAVDPAFTRQGIARLLIDELARIAINYHTPILSLYTVRQTGNVEIFQRLGFEVVSEEPASGLVSDIHADLSEVRMERVLTLGQYRK